MMRIKLFLLVFLLLLVAPAFAQPEEIAIDLGEASDRLAVPKEREGNEADIEAFTAERERKSDLYIGALWICALITLFFGFKIVTKMIKKKYQLLNKILQGIIVLGSLGISLMLIDTLNCMNSEFCEHSLDLWFPVLFIPVFIFSLFTFIGLFKNKRDRFRVNLSSVCVLLIPIFAVLVFLAEMIVRPNFDIPGFIFIPLIGGAVALLLSLVLGIVGYFMDQSEK